MPRSKVRGSALRFILKLSLQSQRGGCRGERNLRTGAKEVFMAKKLFAMALIFSVVVAPIPGYRAAVVNAAQAKLTMDSILQGAKREGKISWASNLVDEEVVALNKAFQKEYPFIKSVEYARMRGPEENERLLSEMQAGIYTHDMVH